MTSQPFTLFRPYSAKFQVSMFTKADDTMQQGAQRIARMKQPHGNRTVIAQDARENVPEADGQISVEKNLLLTVRWADCQNFVLYAPKHNVAGVLHAGWRGLHANAIPNFFTALQAHYNVLPKDVLIGAGPSLCMQCAEFSNPADELPNISAQYIQDKHVNLQQVATDQLQELGVPYDAIERLPDCTKCQNTTYWSYRGGHAQDVLSGRTNYLACLLR